MKIGQTHIWRGRIHNGGRIVVMIFIVLLMAACQMEVKKQRETLQATDTLQKANPAKAASGTREAFPGGDTIQQDCQLVQGQAESLLEEYHQKRTTEARKRQITAALKKLELEWKQKECQQVFGYMIPHIPSPTGTSK